jgi:hypothetical protein
MITSLQTHIYTDTAIDYDGNPLAPHWIYRRFNILGDAVVAFRGNADVSLEHMVDLEDVRAKAPIYSPNMLHFIGEWFRDSLTEGVLLQHLFVCEMYESLLERGIRGLRRRGNDVYQGDRKLNVSIATKSPVSVLMHLGINIETEGTPVPTVGLRELGIDPFNFAAEILERFSVESASWARARAKVLPR